MKILIVDNHDSFTYNLKQLIDKSESCDYDIIKHNEIEINSVARYDKILISPGPELPENHPILSEIIKKHYKSIPILGVCLGFQAIAETFGAKLRNFDEPFHGISKKNQVLSNDLLFNNLPNQFNVGLYHSWYMSDEVIPDELEITSRSEDGIIMSIRHKQHNLHGIQFHPESIMTEFGQVIINNWLRV